MSAQQPNGAAAPKEDYLDKGKLVIILTSSHARSRPLFKQNSNHTTLFQNLAVDAVEKKIGAASGHPVDTNKYRAQNEKFTDKLRGFIERKTGKKVCRVLFHWICVRVLNEGGWR